MTKKTIKDRMHLSSQLTISDSLQSHQIQFDQMAYYLSHHHERFVDLLLLIGAITMEMIMIIPANYVNLV
ncbi:hypothetical protein [Spirochaeta cellobiosiphila]|uniref:hypothetical protein n=1 Tax=Spirochaeta cellobiosiphila TaxID=504483 RepID=UPI0012EC53A1|nr:hypothetical protein [Spirochaeta cellobiosiphila]